MALTMACLLLIASAACLAADWPMPRHDRGLTNRSPLQCDLAGQPRELWRIPTGQWAGAVEVTAGEGPAALALARPVADQGTPVRNKKGRVKRRVVDWQRRLLDVDGSGTLAPVEGYWAKLLPDVPGLQRVAWDNTWTEGEAHIQCFSYAQGIDHPKLEWTTEPVGTVMAPQILLADVNGDGEIEVVTALHYRVIIFEGHSGRKLSELRYHNLRNYGFFGLFFEPGDDDAKFVNVSDFANHLDVLAYNGHDLSVAWRRDVEGADLGGIARHSKIIRPGPNPLEDIDGDGRAELVLNLFNDTGDGRWHVVAYQPLTGTLKLDLAGEYLVGLYDVDGCGRPELLCQEATDRHTTGWRRLRVVKVESGTVGRGAPHPDPLPGGEGASRGGSGVLSEAGRCSTRTLWERPAGRFAQMELRHLPPTADTGAAGGRLTAAAGRIGPAGEPGFVALSGGSDGQATSAQAYLWDGTAFQPGWRATAPAGGAIEVRAVEGRDDASGTHRYASPGRAKAAQDPARVLLAVTAPTATGEMGLQGLTATVQAWQPQAAPAPMPIVVAAGKERYLITEASGDRVAAYRLGERPERLWSLPGRGMGTGSGQAGGITAGDLDGDGRPEVVFAQQDPKSGAACLVAVDLTGKLRWRHAFPGYDSGRPEWNWGGLTLWTLAHLTDPRRLDVYVNCRRSTMHSDVSYALDGRTGRELWAGDSVPINGEPTWGFGGSPVACRDLEGTGLQQVISLYPVCYYVVDGRKGAFVRTVDLAGRQVLPGWAAYGVPVVADFLGNGSLQVLVPSPYVYGLLDREGKAIWSAAVGPGLAGAQVGDFDGDGRLEVARLFAAAEGKPARVELLDGATGQPKGQPFASADLTAAAVAAADVNGDGADEMLLRVGGNALGAVAFRGGPRLLWQAALPAEPASTIVADVDGDGRGEVVVGCADGSVVALGDGGGAPHPSPLPRGEGAEGDGS